MGCRGQEAGRLARRPRKGLNEDGGEVATKERPPTTVCLHRTSQHVAQCLLPNCFTVWKGGSQGGKERGSDGRERQEERREGQF